MKKHRPVEIVVIAGLLILGYYLVVSSVEIFGVSEYKEPNVVRKIGYFSWFLAVLFMVMQSIKERNKG